MEKNLGIWVNEIVGKVTVQLNYDDEKFVIDQKLNQFLHRTAEKMVEGMIDHVYANDPHTIHGIASEKVKLLELFPSKIWVKNCENEYSHRSPFPWYIVYTHRGPIKIGWRKRVIQISWHDSDIRVEAESLFSHEEVTKSGKMIHAWGYDKAKEYINTILNTTIDN